jgi:hypothetical protein
MSDRVSTTLDVRSKSNSGRGRTGGSADHWFKKGQPSANSLERPTRVRSKARAAFADIPRDGDPLLKELLREVTLATGETATVIDLIARSTANVALKGGVRAQEIALQHAFEALSRAQEKGKAEFEKAFEQKVALYAKRMRGEPVDLDPEQIVLADDWTVRYLDTELDARRFRHAMHNRVEDPPYLRELDGKVRNAKTEKSRERLRREIARSKRVIKVAASDFGFVEMPGMYAKVLAAAERTARRHFEDMRRALGETLWARFEAGISFAL